MYTPIRKKPIHKSALGRHHIRVPLLLLLGLLRQCDLWSILAWQLLFESSTMRWRVEFEGLLEHPWLGCTTRRMSTGMWCNLGDAGSLDCSNTLCILGSVP